MFFSSDSKLNSSLVSSLAVILCLLALAGLQVPQLNKLINKSKNASIEELKRDVEAENIRLNLMQKLPSFGYSNLMADGVLLSFLQYFGDDEARDRTGYELSPKYFEIILERDPHFIESYIFMSNTLSLYAGLPEKSISLMDKGLKSLSPQAQPRSYYVWRYRAVDQLLFLGDGKAAQRSFEMAAEWASIQSDRESQNIASASRRTAEFLAKNPDITPAQEGTWATVLVGALNRDDERTVKRVISRIEALGGKVTITPERAVKVKLPERKPNQPST